jgi:chaperone modulatory protein CbpM
MEKDYLIEVATFCSIHNLEFSFISSLKNMGMIEISTIEKTEFINQTQLPILEKIVRLHDELEINLEGIESIIHLLMRMNALIDENMKLKNKLRIYEVEI